MSTETEILHEEVLHLNNSFKKVRRYIRGWHKDLGTLHFGLTGQETIVEKDIIEFNKYFVEN